MPVGNSDSSMLTCNASERTETPATPPWKRFENVFRLCHKRAYQVKITQENKIAEWSIFLLFGVVIFLCDLYYNFVSTY